MSSVKEEGSAKDIASTSGLSAKSIVGLTVYRTGSVNVFEVKHAAGTVFLKSYLGRVEWGGDASWGSGTEVSLP